MSLATIINPLNPNEALLWYCTSPNTNLALEHRALSGASPTPYVDNSFVGPILAPGDFGAVVYANQVTVYGIVKYTDTAGKPQQAVATLSPFFNPVASINNSVSAASINPGKYWSLAATSDTQTHSYVYFLQNPTGSLVPLIHEITLTQQAPTTLALDQLTPSPQTRLAACYDFNRRTRMVFYQHTTGGIQWANLLDKTPMNVQGTSGSAPGTPLAVVTYPALANAPSTTPEFFIFLYFKDQQNLLNVVIHTPGDLDTPWQPVTVLSDAPPIDPTSGLSVVANPAAGSNILYYLPNDGSTTFQPFIHTITNITAPKQVVKGAHGTYGAE